MFYARLVKQIRFLLVVTKVRSDGCRLQFQTTEHVEWKLQLRVGPLLLLLMPR